MNVYIVEVIPAQGWGESYFYVYHNIENARVKIAQLAEKYDMELYNPYFAMRYGADYDREHHITEVILHEEVFED